MRKKILSLALALAMCLGLTIPAFAAKTWTKAFGEGITVTVYPDGSVSYAGSGKLTKEYAEIGVEPFVGIRIDVVIISIGEGLTATDEFKEAWKEFASEIGCSASFNNPYSE